MNCCGPRIAQSWVSLAHPSFRISAYTFGGVRDIWNNDKLTLGIGSDVTFYSTPAVLDRIYGNNPGVVAIVPAIAARKDGHEQHARYARAPMDMTAKSVNQFPFEGGRLDAKRETETWFRYGHGERGLDSV